MNYILFEIFLRGIGAVVYKVPELKNDKLVKISLRSVESEDTTPISQVLLVNYFALYLLLPVA